MAFFAQVLYFYVFKMIYYHRLRVLNALSPTVETIENPLSILILPCADTFLMGFFFFAVLHVYTCT